MVLGSRMNSGLTYHKSMYLSTSPFGFFYIQGALAMPFSRWSEGDDRWIAELFGLSWEKRVRPQGIEGEEAWKEYLNRVEGYLKRGIPVQTYWNWTPNPEEEKLDKIVTPSGERAFWWEGMTQKTRPDTHSFVIVGLDQSNNQVRVNMPIGGWFGLEKYRTMKLSYLKRRIEPLRQDLKYTTIVYGPTGKPPKNEQEVKKLTAHRIVQKIQGDPDAYSGEWNPRFHYGVDALKAMKEDLTGSALLQILDARSRQQGFSPLEILVLMKLGFYQMKFVTSLAAEYLEEERRIPEWEWLSHLHVLYYKLFISSIKLVDLARAAENKGKWAERFEPSLQEMRTTLDAAIDHMKKYPAK
jgi:hypothetical protein